MFFTIGLLVSRSPASYVTFALYYLINNKTLYRAIPLDLDKPLATRRYNYQVEPKFLLIYLEKAKDRRYKLRPVFVNVEIFGYDPSELVKHLYSYK